MHFMKNIRGRAIGKPHMAVVVQYEKAGRKLVLTDKPPVVLQLDALVAPLPRNVVVVDRQRKRVNASGQFYVTTETFDPYHLLIDTRQRGQGSG